jgi:methionyl-tRNA synthetase
VDALNTDSELSRYWPADRHIIGKDIKWFHCVIWPCMLMSAGVPLFKQVFSHGFVNAADGRQMSKSFNNTIDPNDIVRKYPVDTIRYYMLAAATYGSDLNFSEESLVQCHNSELADVLGNLLHRVVNLCHKYCGGVVPQCEHDPAWAAPFDARALAAELPRLAEESALHLLAFKAMDDVRSINKFLTAAEPWKMKGADEARRVPVVRTVMEALYLAAHFLAPIMPVVAENIFKKLGTGPRALFSLNLDFYNLAPGTPVEIGEILFTKLLPPAAAEEPLPGATGSAAAGGAASSKAAKGADAEAVASAAVAAEAASFSDGKYFIADDPEQPDFTKIEVRVGQITRCWNHPEAERLFCEEVHLGGAAANTRQVASGLRQHYTLEQMTGRRVLLVCNLKTAKLAGFESCGMVLAAKSEDGSRVELVDPPEGAELGERVYLHLGGAQRVQGEAWSANKADKKKVWKAVAEHLRTDGSRQLSWKGSPVLTSAGPCTVSTLVDVLVS